MKLGVVQHVFGGAKDDAERFARAKALGIAGVEPDLSLADLADPTEARLRSIRAARDASGLSIPALCVGEHNNLGMSFATWRGDEPANEVRKMVRWASQLGVGALLVPFFFANEPKSVAQRRKLCEQLKPICVEAERLNVDVCFEGVLPATQLWQMADWIGSPAFGVYFDTGNATWIGLDAPSEIRALGKLIRRAHMKDQFVSTGDTRCGTGNVDFAACARALADVGYDDWITIEAFGLSDESLAVDLAAARKFFKV
jgi:sugar phosphate isomerase/epimerase